MKNAFLVTFGGDEMGRNVEFGCVCQDKETAAIAAKGRGCFGGSNKIHDCLVAKDEDGDDVLLGQWGVIEKSGLITARRFNIMPTGFNEKQVAEFIKEQKDVERLNKIMATLNSEDQEILRRHFTKEA